MKPIIIFGNNIISEMLYYDAVYHKPPFAVAAFVVDEKFLNSDTFCGLPLVSFQEALSLYPPQDFDMISTVYSSRRLRSRMEIFYRIKDAGYYMPNYVSQKSDFAPDVVMGESNIIMAMSHIGLHGVMGNCNLIRQSAYIGHDFHIGDGNIFTAGINLGGGSSVGNSCFVGIGASIVDHTNIGDECLIGAGAIVIKNTEPYGKYVGNPARLIGMHRDSGVIL